MASRAPKRPILPTIREASQSEFAAQNSNQSSTPPRRSPYGSISGSLPALPPFPGSAGQSLNQSQNPSLNQSLNPSEFLKMGSKGDYFMGTDNIRRMLSEIDSDINKLKLEFASSQPPNSSRSAGSVPGPFQDRNSSIISSGVNDEGDNAVATFLQSIASEFSKAIALVQQATGDNLEPIHSEQQLLSLINALRSIPINNGQGANDSSSNASQPTSRGSNTEQITQLIQNLVDFWEQCKYAVERVQTIGDKFNQHIMEKMKKNCLSFSTALNAHNHVSDQYTDEVAKFVDRIETFWKNTRLLCASYGNGIKQALFSESAAQLKPLDRLNSNDLRRFAIIRLVPDLCDKLSRMTRVAREWLDRDETYVLDLGQAIREQRRETQDRRREIRAERAKQEELLRSLRSARLLCQNSRAQLEQIEGELTQLQSEEATYRKDRANKQNELKYKQNALEFLEITIAQTRMNFSIKTKKQRLGKQIELLEQSMDRLEAELDQVERLIGEKAHNMDETRVRSVEETRVFTELKREYEKLTVHIVRLQKDLDQVQDMLSRMEVVHAFKTSPDVVDGFYENEGASRDQIKLSPSFRKRLAEKKQRLSMRASIGIGTFARLKKLSTPTLPRPRHAVFFHT